MNRAQDTYAFRALGIFPFFLYTMEIDIVLPLDQVHVQYPCSHAC